MPITKEEKIQIKFEKKPKKEKHAQTLHVSTYSKTLCLNEKFFLFIFLE
jgi:hypothetical protein